ncbi:hypothetical protein SAMN02745823_03773 [Sporobacter termitidis DSM 10068]|uniref:Uncharacterized protein n=1 Tax=Sporobacter termitidis DSM 10068 TaxID=1123282 RepID=A0A1M5ZHZ1_9FIRM|nr:hypothetical protein [Sporobacter termitidis]SHI23850.1 hypothetical protein SAMN02745823_03773 [Sporobacter termitidis DSM 10068]
MQIAVYSTTRKIEVCSESAAGMARCKDGIVRQAIPYIAITAEFKGEWDTPQAMTAELDACIKRLLDTYNRSCGDN